MVVISIFKEQQIPDKIEPVRITGANILDYHEGETIKNVQREETLWR